jgi:adenylosuccinate synthase
MGGELMKVNKERDGFKQPATMDEILENKLAPVIDAVNTHVEKIYHDFNTALHKQVNNMNRVEHDISRMVQVLWGFVNKANARTAALERVLLKGGLDQEVYEAEIAEVEKQLMETGEWESLELDSVAQSMGLDIKGNPEPL